MKESLDFAEEQGTRAISAEQDEHVMLDFRIPRC